MRQEKIIRNRIKCKKCGSVIESFNRHGFVWCPCGTCAVGGGHSYLKRAWDAKTDDEDKVYEEMSEVMIIEGSQTELRDPDTDI